MHFILLSIILSLLVFVGFTHSCSDFTCMSSINNCPLGTPSGHCCRTSTQVLALASASARVSATAKATVFATVYASIGIYNYLLISEIISKTLIMLLLKCV